MNRYAAALYSMAPVWGQNLILTCYSAVLDHQRYGGRFGEFRDLLTKAEWFSESELIAYQDERLRATVKHAYETVPFYRRRFDERKLKPSDIRGQADLPKLPLLTRDDVRSHFDDANGSYERDNRHAADGRVRC
jgi:phenylacetate-CoA ligase